MRALAILALAVAGCASVASEEAPSPTRALPIALGSTRWKSDEPVLCLASSPDGRLLATGDVAGDVRVVDARDGTVLHCFRDLPQTARAVAFSPDGNLLAVVGARRAILRRVGNGAVVGEVRDPGVGSPMHGAAAFSPDGRILAAGGVDAGVVLMETDTGKEAGRWNLQAQTWGATSLQFSSDGNAVVCGCMDGTVMVLEAATGRVLRTHRDSKWTWTPWFQGAAMLDASGAIAAIRYDGILDRWEADGTGGTLFEDPEARFAGVALSPARDRIAVAARDGTLRWLDPNSGAETARFQVSDRALLAVAFVGGPDRVAVAGEDGAIRILDAKTGAVLAAPDGHLGPVYCVAVSPDGKKILSGGRDGTVRLWDVATGMETRLPRAGRAPVYAVSFSTDGDPVVEDGGAFRWDFDHEPADTVPGLREATGPDVEVMAVALSPDGRTVWAARSDGTVVGYDREALRAATMPR